MPDSDSDLFDTSHIPDDPAHWNALAERVAANATREAAGFSLDWLAHSRASWVAASILLAAALVLSAVPAEDSSAAAFAADVAQAIAPSEGVGRAIVSQDEPPAIAPLVLGSQPRAGR